MLKHSDVNFHKKKKFKIILIFFYRTVETAAAEKNKNNIFACIDLFSDFCSLDI